MVCLGWGGLARLGRAGLLAGLDWAELGLAGLGWAGLARLRWAGLGWASCLARWEKEGGRYDEKYGGRLKI